MPISTAQKIIEKIEAERPDLRGKTMNHRRRRTQIQNEERLKVSEVYSPPRLAAAAHEHGLEAGFSLDLTCNDFDGPLGPQQARKEGKSSTAAQRREADSTDGQPDVWPIFQLDEYKLQEDEQRSS